VRHWLAVITVFLFAYSLLPFVAPLLKKAGLDTPAQIIYLPYKFLCHTYGFRSFFLFGDQFSYPRGTAPGQFDNASGIDTATFNGLLASRDFQGNAEMGYKVALCERDVAIYLTMALCGVLFALTRRRISTLPWWLFIVIGLVPIGIDGFSQLLSQPPFTVFPYRESTMALRLLTGALFGLSAVWLVFPILQSTLTPEPDYQ